MSRSTTTSESRHRLVTATGHVVGAAYFSAEHQMTYVVLGPATLWELAPGQAVRLRWANGNETVTPVPPGKDVPVRIRAGAERGDAGTEEAASA
jgi:hypothetical protein